MPKSYKECNRKYIYYSDLHSNAAALSTQKLSRNELLFKDFTGDVEQVGGRREEKKKRSPVLNRMLNSLTSGEITIRGTDLAEAWRLFSLTKDGKTHF